MEGYNRFFRVTERHSQAYGSACGGLICFPEPGEAQDSGQLSCQGWCVGLKAQQPGRLSPKHHLHPNPIKQEMENFRSDETAKGLRAPDWEGSRAARK